MERRKFIRSTVGCGFVTLVAKGTCSYDIFKEEPDEEMTIANMISRGDIHRKSPPVAAHPWVVLYQGNGRFGSCFGPWGLHVPREKKLGYRVHGSTSFTHIKNYVRAKFNADYLIPVGTICWETEPQEVKEYEQYQSFYNGTVTTHFRTSDYAVTVISWFDQVQKDIAGFQIDVKGNCPAVIISVPRLLPVHYDQQIVASVEERLNKDLWQATTKCLNADSKVTVWSDAQLEQVKEGLKLSLNTGRNNILIRINGDINVSADQSLRQTKAWWHKTWKNSGWLDLPDETVQKVWIRSLAYTLYSHNDDGFGDSPPTGLAGNGWPFPFPFDSSCRHLLLLMTGQINIARKWIEFWHSHFEGLKEYTKRIFKSEGIFLPHVFPYGSSFGFHDPEVPNNYYYPVYNSALMVRLADQTAVMVNDPQWTKTYAEPLIHEAAKFYLSHLKKGDDGLWHLHVIPSISLDESGDINKPDYVSGLISAQYTLQRAVEYGLDHDHRMQLILQDGLAYKPLLAENGMYYNHLGFTIQDIGKQKHPDQLFPLIHTPLGSKLGVPHRKAHELRYHITDGASIPRFLGHTLGEFILASARMHDAKAWEKDWDMVLPAKYADPEFIQFYESTGSNLAYYITTHGLFAQAILETIVSTWWNRLDLCSCIPWEGTVRFGNIRTLHGVTVSGEFKGGNGQATLHAWKDTQFKYEGETITLKKGQQTTVKIKKANLTG
jgi:hypothetical protein